MEEGRRVERERGQFRATLTRNPTLLSPASSTWLLWSVAERMKYGTRTVGNHFFFPVTNGPCLSESSLTEEPQARHQGQQTSLGLTKPHFTPKDSVSILETCFLCFLPVESYPKDKVCYKYCNISIYPWKTPEFYPKLLPLLYTSY